jgi:signal peptidase
MNPKKLLGYGLEVTVLALALALILGQVLGHPVVLGFVTSESMSPTLDENDGFVAIPSQVAGPIERGDVIVFRAEEVQGGGLTTHRVVDETDRGYITKGDNNAFTDQDNDEPPVKRAQVVAEVLQIGGQVVVIPHLGDAIGGIRSTLGAVQRTVSSVLGTSVFLGPQGFAYLVFALSLLYYVVSGLRRRNKRKSDLQSRQKRNTGLDSRLVVGAFTLLLVVGATLPMVAPAGTQELAVVSAEFSSERPNVIPAGESETQPYVVGNGGLLPVVTYLESASEGVEVQPGELYVEGRSVANATVTLHAPPETGYYRRFVTEHRYLAVLPQPVIRGLYAVHPWAPIVAIDALIGIPFYLVGVSLVGDGRIRPRSRNRDVSTVTRLRQAARDLYR